MVAVPVFGAVLVPVAARIAPKREKLLSLLLGVITVLAACRLLVAASHGESISYSITFPMGFGLTLYSDYLAAFAAVVSSSISAVIIYYSNGYITESRGHAEYYSMVTLFLGSMMGLVFSQNLIWMFVFWEITAVCSWRLVGYYRGEKELLKANKTFLVTVFGALCMLLGIAAIYAYNGTVDLGHLRGQMLPDFAVLMLMLGIFSKSATLPFSTWLPDAGVAPSPVTALLHAAVLVKIGVYAFARIFCATSPMDPVWSMCILYVAGASTIISAGAALVETDIKRIIAYSTISQIGFIFLGFAVMNDVGIGGAALYILMHGVAKAGLFLCAGIIEHKAHTKDITKMGGLFKTMPVTAVAFGLCAFSVMGIPPFGGFFCKLMVLRGAAAFGHPEILMMFVFGAVLTIIYLLRLFYAVFMGTQRPAENRGHEAAPQMLASVTALGVASLLLGIFIYYPAHYAQTMCLEMGFGSSIRAAASVLPGVSR